MAKNEEAIKPLMTVVTVCYNAIRAGRKEMFLQSIDSVQQQEGISIEHLIIDGASTDGTVDLIRSYQAQHYPIRLISEKDDGIFDAMNKGIRLAQGEYIVFLNTDDYYHNPSGLRLSVEKIKHTGADFSFAPILEVWDGETKYQKPTRRLYRIFMHSVLCHQSIVAKRDALVNLNCFDTTFKSAADYDWELRMIFFGYKGCYVPVDFVSYRMIGQSSMNLIQSQTETAHVLKNNYNMHFGCKMTDEEAIQIHLTQKLKGKYRHLYSRIFSICNGTFLSIPFLDKLKYNTKLFADEIGL